MYSRTASLRSVSAVCFVMMLLPQGCSDSASGNGSGGAVGSGGGLAGISGSGGSIAALGGRTGDGGSRATGGVIGNGGSSAQGGAIQTGGTQAAGGSTLRGDGSVSVGGATGDAGRDAGPLDTIAPDGRASDTGTAGVRLSGRIDLTDSARPTFGWSGSAIYATFNGTGATLQMDGSANQYQVVVDGNVPSVLKFVSGTTQYPIASGLSPGAHDLIVWKRTEGNMGNNSYVGLDVAGGQLLPASPAPDRRIELYGDSISAGYGLDGTYPCTASQDNENHYLTYAAIAARTLSAELHAIAWSGIGMYRNYNQPGPSSDAMPAVYAKTLAYDKTAAWNFSTWLPHAVVINLGTNDASTKGDPGTPYETAYLTFVRTLREKYPDAFFVLSIGPMLDGNNLKAIRTHLQNVISTRATEGDNKMSYLEFPTQSASDGLGCDSHPGPKTNASMATQLVAELKTRLGW